MRISLSKLEQMVKSVVKEHTRKTKGGKIVQVRQHEDIRSKKEAKVPSMSSGLSAIVSEVAKHDSFETAYAAFKHRTGISREVADEFQTKFGDGGELSPDKAFKNLYDHAKGGSDKKTSGKTLASLPEGERKGLQGWVNDYKMFRKYGNVKGAKDTKKNIDAVIKEHGLDSKEVYGTEKADKIKGLKKSSSSPGLYLIKSRVKGHIRRTKGGAVVNVKEHTDSRTKKAPELTATMKKLEKLTGKKGKLDGKTFKIKVGSTMLVNFSGQKRIFGETSKGEHFAGWDNPNQAYKYLVSSGDLKGAAAKKEPAQKKKVVHEYRGVAEEIKNQIGRQAFFMMGAKNMSKGHNEDGTEYLSFKVGRNSKSVTHIKVSLNANDEYDIEFGKIGRGSMVAPGPTYKVMNKVSGIQADQLHEAIEGNTGLYLSL